MPFTCDICNKQYVGLTALKSHKRSKHDKIKDFKCSICPYETATKGQLKQHIKQIHDKIKDFLCSECTFTASNSSDLNRHVKSVHDKCKDIKCDKCDFSASSRSTVARHAKQVHDKIKDFKCDKCAYSSSTNGDLSRHVKFVHDRPQMDKKMSLGEYAIYSFLTKHNISFEKEIKFNDLISTKNKRLRYDFGILYNNIFILIEFDGRQHFEIVRWQNTDSAEQLKDKYNYIVECDQKKNEYAIQHNYPLKRIKYTDFNDIEGLLMEFLQPYFNLTRA